MGQEGRELRVGCVPERAWSKFAVESQDAVTATSVSLGVPELEAELSTVVDGELFTVLLVGGDLFFESWRKLHKRDEHEVS